MIDLAKRIRRGLAEGTLALRALSAAVWRTAIEFEVFTDLFRHIRHVQREMNRDALHRWRRATGRRRRHYRPRQR